MRRIVLALLIVAVAVTACSSDSDGDVAIGDPDVPVTNIPTDPGIGGPAGGEPLVVQPTPGLASPTTVAIDLVRLVDPKTLEVSFYNGVVPCYGVDHVTVDEQADRVTIEVVTGSNPQAGDVACIEIAQLQAVVVSLAAPLGDRIVIDAQLGGEVPVTS